MYKNEYQKKYTKYKVLSFYKINIVRYMRPSTLNVNTESDMCDKN